MERNQFVPSVSREDWSIGRHRVSRDEERHNEKVKEAIQGHLGDVISDGSIITQDPQTKKIIKVPMKSLELPHIRYGEGGGGIGTGKGTDGGGGSQPGQSVPGQGEGEPGDEAGQEYYEAELTIEEIQALVFDDLGLPNIKPKGEKTNESSEYIWNVVRKRRTATNLHMGRTVLQNILRNAQETGVARVHGISQDDYRVRTWEVEEKPKDSAVVLAMADISGSMGEFEKYVTRAFCWWTVSFLRTKYPKVDVVFIGHHTEAEEMTEEQFFTRGVSGGTKCSSANQLALDMMSQRYTPEMYNIYPLHFSDGDNIRADDSVCVGLVNEMLERDISQYAFIEINSRRQTTSNLYDAYENGVSDDRFKNLTIRDKADILPALKHVFSQEEQS